MSVGGISLQINTEKAVSGHVVEFKVVFQRFSAHRSSWLVENGKNSMKLTYRKQNARGPRVRSVSYVTRRETRRTALLNRLSLPQSQSIDSQEFLANLSTQSTRPSQTGPNVSAVGKQTTRQTLLTLPTVALPS